MASRRPAVRTYAIGKLVEPRLLAAQLSRQASFLVSMRSNASHPTHICSYQPPDQVDSAARSAVRWASPTSPSAGRRTSYPSSHYSRPSCRVNGGLQ